MPTFNRKRAGMTLAIVLSVLAVMLVLIYSVATSSSTCLTLSTKEREAEQARYAAEAGINAGLGDIRWQMAFSPNATYTGFRTPRALPSTAGKYSLSVVDNHRSFTPTPCGGLGYLPGQSFFLEATGTVGRSVQKVSVVMSLAESRIFKYSMFAKAGIRMGGTSVFDSYDSRLGPGQPQPTASAAVGTNANIAMLTNAEIKGDASAVGTITGGTVTGNIFQGVAPTIFKTIDCTYREPNDNALARAAFSSNYNPMTRDFVANNGQIFLGNPSSQQPEVYYFNNFKISGSATLEIRGPVTIYTTGDVDLGGGSVVWNKRNTAKNLRIFNSGPNTVKLSGGPEAYYCFYGPQAACEIVGTANMFGSVVANTINITGNAAVTYDLALKDETADGATIVFELQAWDRH